MLSGNCTERVCGGDTCRGMAFGTRETYLGSAPVGQNYFCYCLFVLLFHLEKYSESIFTIFQMTDPNSRLRVLRASVLSWTPNASLKGFSLSLTQLGRDTEIRPGGGMASGP